MTAILTGKGFKLAGGHDDSTVSRGGFHGSVAVLPDW